LKGEFACAKIASLRRSDKTQENNKNREETSMQSLIARAAALVVAATAVGAAGPALPDESRGPILANTCFSCHGTDGHSSGAMPSIDGKSADYIVDTLTRFRDGSKASTVMARIAKGFTDEEIQVLAAYFSGRK
jgi:sulfide dehydrogenase cytochrome subunit